MASSNSPDVRLLSEEKLSEVAFPSGRATEFRIHFHPAAHGRAVAHAKESTSVEICGVLVGDWERDVDGPFVRISDIIRCDNATQKFAEVTFTHDSWTQINREMDTRFANLRIVGWYHSHPDFGIFLSDRDVFIQQNFFGGPGQIAFVVDPVRDAEGVFEWRDGKPKLAAHYWVGGKILGGEATARGGGQVGGPEAARNGAVSSGVSSGAATSVVREASMSRLSMLTLTLLTVLGFLVGHLWGSQRTHWEQLRLVEGTIAHYGVWNGLRPGLEEALAALRGELGTVSDRIKVLSAEHVKLAGDKSTTTAKDWDEIRASLSSSRDLARKLEQHYALTADEQNAIRRMLTQKMVEFSAAEEAARRPAKKIPADKSELDESRKLKPETKSDQDKNQKPARDR